MNALRNHWHPHHTAAWSLLCSSGKRRCTETLTTSVTTLMMNSAWTSMDFMDRRLDSPPAASNIWRVWCKSGIGHAHANGHALLADVKVMIVLQYLASRLPNWCIADEFGISRAGISQCLTVWQNYVLPCTSRCCLFSTHSFFTLDFNLHLQLAGYCIQTVNMQTDPSWFFAWTGKFNGSLICETVASSRAKYGYKGRLSGLNAVGFFTLLDYTMLCFAFLFITLAGLTTNMFIGYLELKVFGKLFGIKSFEK